MRYQYSIIDLLQLSFSIAFLAALFLPWQHDKSIMQLILYPPIFEFPESFVRPSTYASLYLIFTALLIIRSSYNYASVTMRTLTRSAYGVVALMVLLALWYLLSTPFDDLGVGYWLSILSLALLSLLLGLEWWIIDIPKPSAAPNANDTSYYTCTHCGTMVPAQQRRCPDCGAWLSPKERT